MSKMGNLRARQLGVFVLPLATFALTVCAAPSALAGNHAYTVLYTFTGGGDGGDSLAPLIKDKDGNLYGTTWAGCGYGTVFKLALDGTETVLHCFSSGEDGASPSGTLIRDKKGDLYGTTWTGGGTGCNGVGCGTVFKYVAKDNGELPIYTFTGGADGGNPDGGVIMDSAGNLYGTTAAGGAHNFGVVFKLAPDGTETVLHSFAGGSDGYYSTAGLIMDAAGNLYGNTQVGGTYNAGVVFKVTPAGKETVLYTFTGGSDGDAPYNAPLIMDAAGNLYGTTLTGGLSGCVFDQGCGGVFKITP